MHVDDIPHYGYMGGCEEDAFEKLHGRIIDQYASSEIQCTCFSVKEEYLVPTQSHWCVQSLPPI